MKNFIYLLHVFSIYGYITNSQSDQRPVGLITQLVRTLQRYRSVHGLESCSSLIFFQALFYNGDNLLVAKLFCPWLVNIALNRYSSFGFMLIFSRYFRFMWPVNNNLLNLVKKKHRLNSGIFQTNDLCFSATFFLLTIGRHNYISNWFSFLMPLWLRVLAMPCDYMVSILHL